MPCRPTRDLARGRRKAGNDALGRRCEDALPLVAAVTVSAQLPAVTTAVGLASARCKG